MENVKQKRKKLGGYEGEKIECVLREPGIIFDGKSDDGSGSRTGRRCIGILCAALDVYSICGTASLYCDSAACEGRMVGRAPASCGCSLVNSFYHSVCDALQCGDSTGNGLETEILPLPDALYERIVTAEENLKKIV